MIAPYLYGSRTAAFSAVVLFLVVQLWPGLVQERRQDAAGSCYFRFDLSPLEARSWLHEAEARLWKASLALQHLEPYGDKPMESKRVGAIRAVQSIIRQPRRIKELMAHSKQMQCLMAAAYEIHAHVMNGDVPSALQSSQILANLTRGIDIVPFGASAATLAMLMGKPILAEFAALLHRKDYLGALRAVKNLDYRRVTKELELYSSEAS